MRSKISSIPFRFFNAVTRVQPATNSNLTARLFSTNQGYGTYKEPKGGSFWPTFRRQVKRWGSEQSLVSHIKNQRSKSVLNLSDYLFTIKIDGPTLDESPFIKELSACSNVEIVNLSGHDDIKNLEFSRFRKLLPGLKRIILKDIEPVGLRVTLDQIIKCYANNIVLHADSNLMKHLTQRAVQFLISNGQLKYAQSIQAGITSKNLDPKPFQEALIVWELKNKERDAAKKILKEQHKQINLEFLSNYKSGHGFDKESPWYIIGPKSEEDLSNCKYPHTVLTLYAVITQLNCWENVLSCSEPYIGAIELQQVFDHPATMFIDDLDRDGECSLGKSMGDIVRMAEDHLYINCANRF